MSEFDSVRVLREADVRALIDADGARSAVRSAFSALHRGEARRPEVLSLDFGEGVGEAHVKGAWLGADHERWAVKAATGFPANVELGRPIVGGFSMTLSARTGYLDTLILDNGYLTELRTGAAGALAAEALAPLHPRKVAVLGSGRQAGFQLEALARVREFSVATLWGRDTGRALERAAAIEAELGIEVLVAESPEDAVRGADLIITATASREPILRSEWIGAGTHLTAMGSDMPGKQELPVELLERAEILSADDVTQAATQGELQHAIAAGLVRPDQVAPLAELLARGASTRTRDDQITVADLTGVGAQDAAIAGLVAARAAELDVGERLVL